MADNRPKRTKKAAARTNDDQRWADLADHILIIAREIQFRGYTDKRAVRLSQSEGVVMRYLQREPAAAPSHIAAATGLQRTNLSTVLRGLEDKGLIERRAQHDDGRGVTVHLTEHGKTNYSLARSEWAKTVSTAADDDTCNLDAALTLLTAIEAGLIKTRPANPSSPPAT